MKNWKAILNKLPKRTTESSAKLIFRVAVALDTPTPKTIVEIGVYKGQTSKKLRFLFPKANLILVDPYEYNPDHKGKMYDQNSTQDKWDALFKTVRQRFIADEKMFFWRETSSEAATTLQGLNIKPTIVFIDADHRYDAVVADIRAWLPLIKPGGFLCGHDYSGQGNNQEVRRAVNDTLGADSIFVADNKVWIYYVERNGEV